MGEGRFFPRAHHVSTIDFSVLTNYYLSREGILAGSSSSSTSASSGANGATSPTSPTAPQVTPPWNAKNASSAATTLATQVVNGQNIINPNAAQTDVKGASAEYKSLFTLYQGLNALNGMTTQMLATTPGPVSNATLAKTFTSGLKAISTYVEGLNYPNLGLTVGGVSTQTTAKGPAVENDSYTTPTIFVGGQNDAVPAFQGQVQFNINVTKYNGQQVAVPIDLSQMGSTTRTMPNVTSYINSQLQAAGVGTRFADADTPAAPETIQVGGQTVTLPAAQDNWAWTINGDSAEQVSFSAPATAAAVYVAQTAGNVAGYADQVQSDKNAAAAAARAGVKISATQQAANDTLSAPVQQLVKFQTDQSTTSTAPPAASVQPGSANTVAGEAFSTTLSSNIASVQATATGSDGSLYVLANITGTTDGQTIQGAQDVALQKYDSTGNLVYTQTLGAANSASGLSLAVSADGQVAVGGSFTGALDPNNPGNGATTSDSFVTLYDSSGNEVWTQSGTAINNNQVNSVAFGANDAVYVAGQANYTTATSTPSALPSGFISGYSATGTQLFNTTTTGVSDPTSLAVDGSTLVVAGTSSAGDAVLNSYTLPAAKGAPTLNATRDLGALNGGSLAGIAINNGQVVVAGTTTNANLSAGTVTSASAGGKQAFVAQLSENLAPGATDELAYFGGPGGTSTTATALSVSDGQIYIAGTSNTALPGMPKVGSQDGYVAAVNLSAGSLGWSERFTAQDGYSSPESIAVASSGASVLDRLGLPQQTLQYTSSQLLTTATSVRAGDSFEVLSGQSGAPVKVTIAADDTPATLAKRIAAAAGYHATVTVVDMGGQNEIQIKPANASAKLQLLPGPSGSDALGPLGLSAGVIQTQPALTSTTKKTAPTYGIPPNTYGLNIAGSFDLTTTTGIQAAQKTIQTAMAKVQTAYYGLVNANTPQPTTPAITGTVPAYIQAQLANYQAGLSRLTGSSSSSSSGSSYGSQLASLFG
jgi:hypothetical protein